MKDIRLNSYDDIFSTEENRIDSGHEKVIEIRLAELYPFRNHPFKVLDDTAMQDTVDSIKVHGVLVPAIARPRKEGGYELISGHRRKRACELAGLETMPVIIRELDNDDATIVMVNSNIQREHILPSERAFAYKMKLEAMKRQGERVDLTCAQVGHKLDGRKSRDILAEQIGESKSQISRYIHLTELTPKLLEMVDTKKIAFSPAVELSYLKPEEQEILAKALDSKHIPSNSQAQQLKKCSQKGNLTEEGILEIMSEDKENDLGKVTISGDKLKKYFPVSYTQQQMMDVILKLLEQWSIHNT